MERMIDTFLATINPMLRLFICITIGFVLSKTKILTESASKVMAKLEVWVFCPAFSFYTMAYYCTIDNIGKHAVNLVLSVGVVSLIVPLACLLSRAFVRKTCMKETFINMGLHLLIWVMSVTLSLRLCWAGKDLHFIKCIHYR